MSQHKRPHGVTGDAEANNRRPPRLWAHPRFGRCSAAMLRLLVAQARAGGKT